MLTSGNAILEAVAQDLAYSGRRQHLRPRHWCGGGWKSHRRRRMG